MGISISKPLNFLRRLRRNKVQSEELEAWKDLEEAEPPGDARVIYAGHGQRAVQQVYSGNDIHTAKYNVVTFLPIFLFTMFSRVAYLYFLSQCALAYWSTISPFSPFGPTIALLFVLGVAAVKAIVEDKKRHQEDHKTNSTVCHIVHEDGTVKDAKWRDVCVGQILEVRDNEDFPADLLCLACARADGVAYIRTTNLDGETNLKIRRPVSMKQDTPNDGTDAVRLRAVLQCEPPNPDLHTFLGKLTYHSNSENIPKVMGLSMNEILLRGCTLKNSKTVWGLVIYTGPETRIQQNAAAPPRKLGSFDGFLNVNIVMMLILQVSLCLGCAVGSYVWRQRYGKQRYHLALDNGAQGNYQNGWAYVAVVFLTFWILFSYTIPISLFVTMEIIKFALSSVFITFDTHLRDRLRREYPKARNSDIVEDLGLVDYVFSDKTGTLTSNEMQLRLLAIKERSFGSVNFKLETQQSEIALENLRLYDEHLAHAMSSLRQQGYLERLLAAGGSPKPILALSSCLPNGTGLKQSEVSQYLSQPQYQNGGNGNLLIDTARSPDGQAIEFSAGNTESQAAVLLGHHFLDFWINLCVCHNLITEEAAEGERPVYQGPSPDEVALVEGARQLGFEFVGRSRTSLTLNMMGTRVSHQVLNSLDFTSQRARMSVVARAPDGTIRLYCKGADNVMTPRLRKGVSPDLLARTAENLRLYSVQGLRTLLICTRILSEEEWRAFDEEYQAAAASIEDRDQRLAAVAELIEKDFELVGATAIEDKLQEGVPAAISTLVAAHIKVIMITGDKQETAINIATSCKLIGNLEKLMLCNAPFSREAAVLRMQELLAILEKPLSRRSLRDMGSLGQGLEMVIDGQTLARILGEEEHEMMLASLIVWCTGVIVCRASPAQKAAIVLMMKRYHAKKEAGGQRKGIMRLWRALTSKLYSGLRGKHSGSSMRMLAIGDGANDVAMIQAAHIGVGIMGHEGRQATNNSDFAISQFRFLTRLLLVHGTLTTYRLGRLIKYSFYKNVSFAFMLFYYQIFCGFSGQALLDGITAAFYNAAFTALPVAAFAIFDRPLRNLDLLAENPGTYNRRPSPDLSASSFWKTGIFMGLCHGAVIFFIPYLSTAAKGTNTTDDVFTMGKGMFIAVIGVVTIEIAIVSKFWTRIFAFAWSLSYLFTFPWLIIIPLLYQAFNKHAIAQWGVGVTLFSTATFWLSILLVYIITSSLRIGERAIHSIWMPTDTEILAEHERATARNGGPMSEQDRDPEEIELQHRPSPEAGSLNGSVAKREISAVESGQYVPLESPTAEKARHHGERGKEWFH